MNEEDRRLKKLLEKARNMTSEEYNDLYERAMSNPYLTSVKVILNICDIEILFEKTYIEKEEGNQFPNFWEL